MLRFAEHRSAYCFLKYILVEFFCFHLFRHVRKCAAACVCVSLGEMGENKRRTLRNSSILHMYSLYIRRTLYDLFVFVSSFSLFEKQHHQGDLEHSVMFLWEGFTVSYYTRRFDSRTLTIFFILFVYTFFLLSSAQSNKQTSNLMGEGEGFFLKRNKTQDENILGES